MPNPLYQQMSGERLPGPMGQFQQFMSAFRQFKESFKGDPQQEVQRLLNSGEMSQEQYNQLQQTAMQMSRMIGR